MRHFNHDFRIMRVKNKFATTAVLCFFMVQSSSRALTLIRLCGKFLLDIMIDANCTLNSYQTRGNVVTFSIKSIVVMSMLSVSVNIHVPSYLMSPSKS